MERITRYFWIILSTCVLLTAASCTPPHVLYLTPGRNFVQGSGNGGFGNFQLQPFFEEFGDQVGEHRIGFQTQVFKVKSGRVAEMLNVLLTDQLVDKNYSFASGEGWDLTMAGLDRKQGSGTIVGGRITNLAMKAETNWSRTYTTCAINMDVDCFIGYGREKKIIRRTVHISEKVVTFLFNQANIEKLLDETLHEAAVQVIGNIQDLI